MLIFTDRKHKSPSWGCKLFKQSQAGTQNTKATFPKISNSLQDNKATPHKIPKQPK